MVVSLSRILVLEVAVIGTDKLDAIFLGKLHKHSVHLLLQGEHLPVGANRGIGDLMTLQFQIEIVAK